MVQLYQPCNGLKMSYFTGGCILIRFKTLTLQQTAMLSAHKANGGCNLLRTTGPHKSIFAFHPFPLAWCDSGPIFQGASANDDTDSMDEYSKDDKCEEDGWDVSVQNG